MAYELRISNRAQSDIEQLKRSGNNSALKKLGRILQELIDHPKTGLGHPEQLKGRPNTYSRQLTKKDRVVYSIFKDIVLVDVLQVLQHYSDK